MPENKNDTATAIETMINIMDMFERCCFGILGNPYLYLAPGLDIVKNGNRVIRIAKTVPVHSHSQKNLSIVSPTNNIEHPRAVMIHIQNELTRNSIVMGTWRFRSVAFLAVPPSIRVFGR